MVNIIWTLILLGFGIIIIEYIFVVEYIDHVFYNTKISLFSIIPIGIGIFLIYIACKYGAFGIVIS